MKQGFRVTFIFLMISILLPSSVVRADIMPATIKIGSFATQSGASVGTLTALKVKDQSGTADTPSKYVLFSTPGVKYRGTRTFTLPTYINSGNLQSIRFRVNIKAPDYSSQAWIWKIFDWNANSWVSLGRNSTAIPDTWSTLNFNAASNPGRFLNASRQVKIQFSSNNASGDAKIDSEFMFVQFDYQFSGCGESINDTYESQVLTLINQQRNANGGLPALSRDTRLDTAARLHSTDMACNNFFSHTNLLGIPFDVRITNQGYNYWYAGENIAAGYATPADVVTGWMNSSGHRANILNSNFTQIGIGYAYYGGSSYGSYWTTDFASPAP